LRIDFILNGKNEEILFKRIIKKGERERDTFCHKKSKEKIMSAV